MNTLLIRFVVRFLGVVVGFVFIKILFVYAANPSKSSQQIMDEYPQFITQGILGALAWMVIIDPLFWQIIMKRK